MKKIYIANWKMQLDYRDSLAWCALYQNELEALAQQAKIIICPTAPAIHPMSNCLRYTQVKIGAQNCSSEGKGAFTGEISAATLAQIGTTYCIVGHSERRQYFSENSESIARKIAVLSKNRITPIVCVASMQQFEELQETIQAHAVYIAFEPTAAIGSGIAASTTEITVMLHTIRAKTKESQVILYGGSVSENNIQDLKNIQHLDGFLIGNASLDFQLFKKIVLSTQD
jgi:triosephosphate isomerase